MYFMIGDKSHLINCEVGEEIMGYTYHIILLLYYDFRVFVEGRCAYHICPSCCERNAKQSAEQKKKEVRCTRTKVRGTKH